MQKSFIIALILLTVTTSSCQNKEEKTTNNTILKKGHLVYEYKAVGMTLGFDFKFDEENVRINQSFISNISKIKLINKNIGEVLHLNKDSKTNAHFFYSSIQRMIALQKGSTYGDTIVTKTKEYKNLLGYKCNKTILNFGKQVEVVLWTTDKIKTGIIFPNTPLTLDETALEYEMKILGETRNHYIIKSIKDISSNDKDFISNIPDEYSLIVPNSIYSLEPNLSKNNFTENMKNIEYPCFKQGKEAVGKYFNTIFSKLNSKKNCRYFLTFIINKSGDMEQLDIRGCNDIDKIKNELKNMPKWIPGKVNGVNINSSIHISE